MILKHEIQQFQSELEEELNAHDEMLSNWDALDWHERFIQIEHRIHHMWALYDKAEELSGYIRHKFPPYPFNEIKEIQRWLKQALHRMDDFIDDEYHTASADDYQEAYMSFLSVIFADTPQKCEPWLQRESFIAHKEQDLLDILNRSYSVILELLLKTYKDGKNDTQNIHVSYVNALARYEQLQWSKDEKLFQARLETKFPWEEGPTANQLQNFYAELSDELLKAPCGKEYSEHHNNSEKLAVAIADLQPTEEQLTTFFRRIHELEYLQQQITILHAKEQRAIAEGTKRLSPIEQTFTFKYRQEVSFNNLVDFLNTEKQRDDFYADSDWARHALAIYEWQPNVIYNRPATFKQWHQHLCQVFGREYKRDYDISKLRTKKKSKVMQFAPQKNVG